MFEEKLIKQIQGGFLGIKLGTKNPKEVFDRLLVLKKYNPLMFDDLLNQYQSLVKK